MAWNEEQEDELPGIVERSRENGYDAIRALDTAELYPPGATAAPRNASPPDAPPRGRFALRSATFFRAPHVEIVQADDVLWRGRLARVMPGRSTRLTHGWTARVAPDAGEVRVRLATSG